MTNKETYTIAELACEFNVTSRAIRFYEDQGLIKPKRDGQARVYNKADYARLAWILRGKSVGFSLIEIGELLDLYKLEDGRRTQRQATLTMCYEKIAGMKRQQEDISQMVKELTGFCALLEELETEEKVNNTAAK